MKKRLETLSIILAGGKGSRLGDITKHRVKPAVPFGGVFRLIDFPLSNLHHSKLSDVWVIEQYRPHSLNDHLRNGRPWDLDRTQGGLSVLTPFEGAEKGKEGFTGGNASALNLQHEFIKDFDADLVLVLSADHLYRLDYRDLIDFHVETGADLSAMVWEAPPEFGDVSRYSVFETKGDEVTHFHYKPEEPPTRLVGMEVFLFTKTVLLESLERLHEKYGDDLGDYGDHLLPMLVKEKKVRALRHEGYWRDVGTVESYWEAHMQLLEEVSPFRLDDAKWPFITDVRFRAPAHLSPTARVTNSLLSPCCQIAGTVTRSILGPGCVVEKGAVVEDSILMEGAHIGPRGAVKKAVLDAGCYVDEAVGDGKEVTLHFPEGDDSGKSERTRGTFA